MEKEKVCILCGLKKELKKFGRNFARGKKYGYKKKCYSCEGKVRWKKKPLGVNKFDSRFKWAEASYDEKISHTRLVYESNVIKKEGCWDWNGQKDKDGYCDMTFEKRPMKGHRISWLLHKGPIPEGKWILHHCDMPSCTRPSHLFIGTPKDNWDDMVKKGRRIFKRGSLCSWAKLTERKVKKIRRLAAEGKTESWLAEKYDISMGVISDIKRRRTWKHVN